MKMWLSKRNAVVLESVFLMVLIASVGYTVFSIYVPKGKVVAEAKNVLTVKITDGNISYISPDQTLTLYAKVNTTKPCSYQWSYQLIFNGSYGPNFKASNITNFGTNQPSTTFTLSTSCEQVVLSVTATEKVNSEVSGEAWLTLTDPTALTLSAGPYPGAASYTIWTDGTYSYTKDIYGVIDYTAIDPSTIVNPIITSGVSVQFLTGSYNFANPLVISGVNGVVLFCSQSVASLNHPLSFSGTYHQLIRIINSQNITIQGFNIAGATSDSDAGITILGSSNIHVVNNIIYEWDGGISVDGNPSDGSSVDSNIFIVGNTIYGMKAPTGFGIYTNTANDVTVQNNIIDSSSINIQGIYVDHYTIGLVFEGNTVSTADDGVSARDYTSGLVTGNFFTDNNNGFDSYSHVFGWSVTGNLFNYSGARIDGTNCTLTGNVFKECTSIDIYGSYNVISNNIISGLGPKNPAAPWGITLESGSSYNTISGNSITAGAASSYGIFMIDSTYNSINGNTINGMANWAIIETGSCNYNSYVGDNAWNGFKTVGANSHAAGCFNSTTWIP